MVLDGLFRKLKPRANNNLARGVAKLIPPISGLEAATLSAEDTTQTILFTFAYV